MIVEKLRSLPVFALAGLAFVILASASGVATLAVSTTNTSVNFSAENFVLDADSTVGSATITKAASSQVANGQAQGSAVEATTSMAPLRTTLTASDFVYEFTIQEISVNAWPSTRVYRLDAFSDGTLMDTLYIQNSTADAGNVEGVTVNFSLGNTGTLPDSITVKLEVVTP